MASFLVQNREPFWGSFSGPFFVDVLVSFWQLSLDTNAMKYMFRWLFGEDVIIHISVLIYYYTYLP